MPSKKRLAAKIAKVQLKDLKPKKNPKGGLNNPLGLGLNSPTGGCPMSGCPLSHNKI